MKLVFIMPVKLSKVSEIIFSKKKCQVIDDWFNAPFCVTGILKYQVEGKQHLLIMVSLSLVSRLCII